MSMERWLPVYRSPFNSLMNPPMELSRWDDFQDSFRLMDQQMRSMCRDMNRMAQEYDNLAPQMSCLDHRNNEMFKVENPVHTDKDGSKKLHIQFDVRHFKPDEIKVKTKDNKFLEVTAQHEDRSDSGHSYREYKRVFSIPNEVDPKTLKSQLSPEGFLIIEAPIQAAIEAPKEPKNIAITHE